MKKLLVLALLIASVTFIFAVESDFSDVVGYVKYECISNANGDASLVALSMNSGYTLASELGAVYPEITTISTWDNENKILITATNYGGGFWFPDAELNANQGFFVTTSTNIDIFVAGSLNGVNSNDLISNANGDSNLITIPVQSNIAFASELGTEITQLTTLSEWDNVNKLWITATNYGGGFWFPDTALNRGSVYSLTVSENTTWPNVGSRNIHQKTLKNNKK